MAAIFTGLGAGFARGSGSVIGAGGSLGSAAMGRSGEGLSVNAATGNLVLTRQDEFLAGPSQDFGISRTYNSLAEVHDQDNGDKWQMSTVRRVYGLTGTLNTAGSTIKRLAPDGSVSTYMWGTRGGVAAYWTTDGAGAHDKLQLNGTQWTWTDGASQFTEGYDTVSGSTTDYRIVSYKDNLGAAVTFTYSGTLLDKVMTSNGEYLQYTWSSNRVTEIKTGFKDLTMAVPQDRVWSRTSYAYDTQDRLQTVTVDLSPDMAGVADLHSYKIWYDYGANGLVSDVHQSDGSRTQIEYDGSSRVWKLTEHATTSDLRVTTFTYGADYTLVQAPNGQSTRLEYSIGGGAADRQLLKIIAPPAFTGASQQVQTFDYLSDGNLTKSTAPNGAVTNYTYDDKGNLTLIDNPVGTDFIRTFGAGNRLTVEESYGSNELYASVSHYTCLAYDAAGQLRYRVSPDGRVTEYGYSNGRLDRETRYTTDIYTLTSTPVTQAQLDTWRNGHSDKTKRSVTTYYYDARGNVSHTYEYVAANSLGDADGAQGVTLNTFAYDHLGRLIASSRGDEARETFFYDGLGRVIASSDRAGAVTSVFFDDAGMRTVMHMSSGLNRTLSYNKAGDLIGEVESSIGWTSVTDTDINSWSTTNLQKSPRTDSKGKAAVLFQVDQGGAFNAVSASTSIQTGETLRYRVTMKAHGTTTTHQFGISTYTAGWGSNIATDTQAVIVSGPGRLSQLQGGLWQIDGISDQLETTIEVVRTFVDPDGAVASFYVGGTGSGPAWSGVILSEPSLARTIGDSALSIAASTANSFDKLGRLRTSYDEFDTRRRTYFVYDDAGRKTGEIEAAVSATGQNLFGDLTEFVYDANDRVIAFAKYANNLTAAQLDTLSDPNNTVTIATLRPYPQDAQRDERSWTIHDNGGQVLQTIDGTGAVTAYEYDGMSRVVRTTVHATRVSTTGFITTPPVSPVAVTSNAAADSITRTFYDRDGNLRGTLDGEGYLVEFIYDAGGRKIEEIGYSAATAANLRAAGSFSALKPSAAADDRRTRFVYDQRGLLSYQVDVLNQVTGYIHNSAGRLTATRIYANPVSVANYAYATVKAAATAHADDRVTSLTLDAAGRTISMVDPANTTTTNSYDAVGNPTKVQVGTGANVRITRNWYDARGNLRFGVDPEGFLRKYTYTVGGRLSNERTFGTAVSVGDSTTIAQVAALATGGSTEKTFWYDALGRLIKQSDETGNYTEYAFSSTGQMTQVAAGYANGGANQDLSISRFDFDAAGRRISETSGYGDSEAASRTFGYTASGQQSSTTDAKLVQSTSSYDRRGLLTSTTDRAGQTTAYEYNAFGEAVKVMDPRGNATYTYFDQLGRAKVVRDAKSYVTATTYTAFGEIKTVTRRYNATTDAVSTTVPPTVTAHAKDAVTQFEYDKMGRVKRILDALNKEELFAYDTWGNRASATNKLGGVTTYEFNRRGLKTRESSTITSSDNGTTYIVNTFEYDARGNRTKLTEALNSPEQRVTLYAYDAANRLTKIVGPAFQGLTPETVFTYDARGNRTSQTAPGGFRSVYYYDDLNRVVAEISAAGTYTSHEYDKNGNVTSTVVYATKVMVPVEGGAQEEAPVPPTGTYRLTSFQYDQLDRQTKSFVHGVATASYIGSTWTEVGDAAPLETQYAYDANGNVVKTIDPAGHTSWAYYDVLNRKTEQVDAGSMMTRWDYDAEGNVLKERRYADNTYPTSTTTPPWVQELNDSNRVTEYTYDTMGNRLSETRKSVLVHNGSGGVTSVDAAMQYLYNGLGQVTKKTEATSDFIDYNYDSAGRLTREMKSGYADHAGTLVNPVVQYLYDGTGNLKQTTQGGTSSSPARITAYGYEGGNLIWTADAEYNDGTSTDGKQTFYQYDVGGRVVRESYTRRKSDGTTQITEGVLKNYDAAGRVIEQWLGTYNGSVWTSAANALVTTTTYNAYGEVETFKLGGGAVQTNQHDRGGRLIGTNAGDGVWKYFAYDKNGNQTAMVESAGGDIAWQTFDWSLGQAYRADINATYTVYDARNLAVAVHEEGRDLADGVSGQTLSTYRTYNAFGEVARETSAAGAQIDYTYNTMGKLVRVENPTVSVQYEDGSTATVRPTEHFYYDQSGRLVAQRDANGNLTRLGLLAGTGYDGGQALVTAETHADGGTISTAYDAHGDARRITNEVGRVTELSYDQMGRLVQKTDHGSGLTDYYGYDGLGQQLTHWNSLLGYGNSEVSDYDHAGRVISSRAFGGDVTTTSYGWDAAIGGGFGGWSESTIFANGRSQFTNTDIFGKIRARGDQGGHTYHYYYDTAGRLSAMTQEGTSARQDYTYYNTGKLKTITVLAHESGSDYNSQTTAYGYDRAGNVVLQRTTEQGQETYSYGYYDSYEPETYTNSWNRQTQNIAAAYDALGRMLSWNESGPSTGSGGTSTGAPAASASYGYDANGNIRRVSATYRPLDQQGNDAGYTATQEDWYRYDGMNRVVISHGSLAGGAIARGTRGKAISYDAAGRRVQVWGTTGGSYRYWVDDGGGGVQQSAPLGYEASSASGYWATVYYDADVREDYSYDAAGRVSQVQRAEGWFDGEGYEARVALGMNPNPQNYVYAPGVGLLTGVFGYDAMGRLASQSDYADGSSVVYSRAVQYDTAGRIFTDDSTTRRGGDLLRSYSTSYYSTGESAASSVTATNWKNGGTAGAPATSLANSYVHWDGAVQSQVRYDSDTGSGANPLFTSSYKYDAFGRLTSAAVNDGRPRTVTYTNDVNGQAIRRDEADNTSGGDPHELYYRLAGKQLGAVGNNGTANVDYQASNDQRSAVPGTGAFRGGAASGYGFAEFGGDYDAINSYAQGSAGGLYTVRSGDSLQAIAMQLWGDAGLWYKLAEANGLSAGATLAEGRTLSIPTGVQRVHNNANTMKPYDPAEALGDTSPTTPTPATASPKKNKCGAFGAILLAVVAVAVTLVLKVPMAGLFAKLGLGSAVGAGSAMAAAGAGASIGVGSAAGIAGAVSAAAIGSVASQGLGVATGIQDKFNWKAVGMASLGALGGIGAGAVVGNGGKLLGDVARGALGSAAIQGIGLATGLQSKFSWAGVAAAGVGAMAGGALGAADSFGNTLATSTASALANAATRSALEGSSFGDNILAAIPDVIGQAVGGALASAAMAPSLLTALAKAAAVQLDPTILDDSTRFADFRQTYKETQRAIQGLDLGENPYANADALAETYAPLLGFAADGEAATRALMALRTSQNIAVLDAIDGIKLAALGGASITVTGSRYRPTGAALGLKLLDSLAIQAGNLGVELGQAYGELPQWAKYGITAIGLGVDAAAGPIGFAVRRIAGEVAGKANEAAATFLSGRFLENGYGPTHAALGGAGAVLVTTLVLAGATAGKQMLASGVIGRSVDRFKDIARQLRPGAALSRSVFELPPVTRGNVIERAEGQNLPQNFPVIDKFDGKTITSIKSLDLTAASYQNTRRLERRLEDYVDKVAGFQSARMANREVIATSDIQRVLRLVVPSGASRAQLNTIQSAISYGKAQGVTISARTLR